jgi:hypothetical protein
MKLFHGSNTPIDIIDLNLCQPYKDFGRGFYLTTIEEQAVTMAKRTKRIYGGTPCVTAFDFDIKCLESGLLSVKIFEIPSEEWAVFVLNNRNRDYTDHMNECCNHDNKYDIVTGPVANDDIALLFRTFSNGVIDIEILVKELKFRKLTDQFSFHTEKSLTFLNRIGDCFYG